MNVLNPTWSHISLIYHTTTIVHGTILGPAAPMVGPIMGPANLRQLSENKIKRFLRMFKRENPLFGRIKYNTVTVQ